jgi:hypothetical protein
MVEHPFMQLDKAAVSAIDMAEHRNKSAQEPKTGLRKLGDPKAVSISLQPLSTQTDN